MDWLKQLEGYRTYLSAGSNMLLSIGATLSVIATAVGALPIDRGLAIAAVCMTLSQGCNAAAQIFQRLATAKLSDLVEPSKPDATPAQPPVDFDDAARSRVTGVMGLMLAVLSGAAGIAAAQEGVSIIGPTEVQAPGLPCELHLQGVESTKKVDIAWKVFPPVANVRMVEAREGGKIARLTTIGGKWSIICAYHVEGEPIRFVTHETTVPGAPYTPPPGPAPTPSPLPLPPAPPIPTPPAPVPGPNVDPSPTPKPPAPTPPAPAPELPAGDFDKLPARVRDLAAAVNSTTRAAEALKLADAIEGIAAQIAAGTLTGPQNIVNALGVSLNANTNAAWDDCRAKMVDSLKALYMGGKLKTPSAWSTMLREVVTGLRAVK